MRVFLEAISFNHDSTSAETDALNIRRNECDHVEVPEWRSVRSSVKPEDSPAAYAICMINESCMSIRASFSTPDHLKKVFVRATPIPTLGTDAMNCLGRVAKAEICFTEGKAELIPLDLTDVRIKELGVGVCNIAWHWEYQLESGGDWIDLATTKHRIYRVLHPPPEPWEQSPFDADNIHLPWTDVLDYACVWAATAKGVDEAAHFVTRSVYDLGTTKVLEYQEGVNYSGTKFDCTAFIERLRGQFGFGAKVNCTDCATIVSTFANALGCELSQAQMGPPTPPPLPPRGLIPLQPHLRIGAGRWQQGRFTYHEVAWEGCGTKDDEVHDACLMVDGDDDPGVGPPQIPLLPSNLLFGTPTDGNYRFRLALPPPARGVDPCQAHPHTSQRRKLGRKRDGGVLTLSDEEFERLKRLYDFNLDEAIRRRPTGVVFVEDFDLRRQTLPRLDLFRWTAADKSTRPWWVESFWEVGGRGAPGVLKIEAFVTESPLEASKVLAKLITEFETELLPVPEHEVGDISVSEESRLAFLFMRHKYAFAIRNVGTSTFPVVWVARLIDKLLMR